ncbi:hypothetical protein MR642_01525 [bacterium]|nr:hypothetical protein [bacterium]
MPSRSLIYPKLVQGECRENENPQDFHFTMPSRSLIYPKLVQGECREKGKGVQSERKEGETKVFHSFPNCSRLYLKAAGFLEVSSISD